MGKEIAGRAIAGLSALFVTGAAAALWILPSPHIRLHYVLAGSVATALVLAATYVMLMASRAVRRAPSGDVPEETIRRIVRRERTEPQSPSGATLGRRPGLTPEDEPPLRGQR